MTEVSPSNAATSPNPNTTNALTDPNRNTNTNGGNVVNNNGNSNANGSGSTIPSGGVNTGSLGGDPVFGGQPSILNYITVVSVVVALTLLIVGSILLFRKQRKKRKAKVAAGAVGGGKKHDGDEEDSESGVRDKDVVVAFSGRGGDKAARDSMTTADNSMSTGLRAEHITPPPVSSTTPVGLGVLGIVGAAGSAQFETSSSINVNQLPMAATFPARADAPLSMTSPYYFQQQQQQILIHQQQNGTASVIAATSAGSGTPSVVNLVPIQTIPGPEGQQQYIIAQLPPNVALPTSQAHTQQFTLQSNHRIILAQHQQQVQEDKYSFISSHDLPPNAVLVDVMTGAEYRHRDLDYGAFSRYVSVPTPSIMSAAIGMNRDDQLASGVPVENSNSQEQGSNSNNTSNLNKFNAQNGNAVGSDGKVAYQGGRSGGVKLDEEGRRIVREEDSHHHVLHRDLPAQMPARTFGVRNNNTNTMNNQTHRHSYVDVHGEGSHANHNRNRSGSGNGETSHTTQQPNTLNTNTISTRMNATGANQTLGHVSVGNYTRTVILKSDNTPNSTMATGTIAQVPQQTQQKQRGESRGSRGSKDKERELGSVDPKVLQEKLERLSEEQQQDQQRNVFDDAAVSVNNQNNINTNTNTVKLVSSKSDPSNTVAQMGSNVSLVPKTSGEAVSGYVGVDMESVSKSRLNSSRLLSQNLAQVEQVQQQQQQQHMPDGTYMAENPVKDTHSYMSTNNGTKSNTSPQSTSQSQVKASQPSLTDLQKQQQVYLTGESESRPLSPTDDEGGWKMTSAVMSLNSEAMSIAGTLPTMSGMMSSPSPYPTSSRGNNMNSSSSHQQSPRQQQQQQLQQQYQSSSFFQQKRQSHQLNPSHNPNNNKPTTASLAPTDYASAYTNLSRNQYHDDSDVEEPDFSNSNNASLGRDASSHSPQQMTSNEFRPNSTITIPPDADDEDDDEFNPNNRRIHSEAESGVAVTLSSSYQVSSRMMASGI
jgi:hypothetical protein